MRKVSEKGIALIITFEGEILRVYLDPIQKATFGVGHLVKPFEAADFPVGKKITRAVSREYLRKDLERFERCVNEAVNVPITQNQFDALVSFAFNVGEKNFKRSSVLRNLNNRHFAKAADSFLAWNKAKGRVLPGLVRRRKAERALFLEPDSATDAPIETPQTDAVPTAETPATQSASDTPLPSNTDPNQTPPVQVTTGSTITNYLFTGGMLSSIGASVWAWVTSNANVVAIAVICVTVLILAVIFRKAILDAIRLTLNADPNKHNVT